MGKLSGYECDVCEERTDAIEDEMLNEGWIKVKLYKREYHSDGRESIAQIVGNETVYCSIKCMLKHINKN